MYKTIRTISSLTALPLLLSTTASLMGLYLTMALFRLFSISAPMPFALTSILIFLFNVKSFGNRAYSTLIRNEPHYQFSHFQLSVMSLLYTVTLILVLCYGFSFYYARGKSIVYACLTYAIINISNQLGVILLNKKVIN